MSLLLDGPPSTIDDLTARDSDVLNVASAEGIDLTTKLKLAASDITMALNAMLTPPPASYSMTQQSFPAIGNIAVNASLKLWHTYATLQLVYQDLYYSRLNDRYKLKMDLFIREEAETRDFTRTTGFAVVYDPIPKAVAPATAIIQSGDAAGTIYVSVTYLNNSGEEGLYSDPIEVDTQDSTAARISLESPAYVATGWNVYAGLAPDSLALQNSAMLDPAVPVSLAPGRLIAGVPPGPGQTGNLLYPIPRKLIRG